MGAIVKRRFINGFQYHSDCFLQKFILEGRYSKRTLLSVSLFNILPPDLGNPRVVLCIGKWRLSDMLSVRYDALSRLFHSEFGSWTGVDEDRPAL